MSKETKLIVDNDGIYDYTEWLIEKFNQAIRSLTALSQNVVICKNKDYVDAMSHLLNILSCLNGKLLRINSDELFPIISQYGEDGYYFILDLFNNTHNGILTKQIIEIESANKSLSIIYDLIRENVKTNRTLINCELDNINVKNPFILQLESDLELVNSGEKTWEWFYNNYKEEKYQISQNVDSSLVELYKNFEMRIGKLTVN